MHLIYIRFYTKFLRDLGLLKFDEPALKYFTQGIVHGSDGNKMSKSLGNIVDPLNMVNKCGADSLRLALISFATPDKDSIWNDKIMLGSYKFINKLIAYFSKVKKGKSSKLTESKLNKTIKEMTDDIENFRYNLAIVKLRELFESFGETESKEVLEKFLKLLSPFCPHIAEELWHKLGNKRFISLENWPKTGKVDEKLLKEEEQVELLAGDIKNIMKILEQKGKKAKKKIKIFTVPSELALYKQGEEKIKNRFNLEVEVLNVKEAAETGKIIKAKPGKPGILIE